MDTWESSPVLNITSRMGVMSQDNQGCLILCAKSTWNMDIEGAPISQRTLLSHGFLSFLLPITDKAQTPGHPVIGGRLHPAMWAPLQPPGRLN